MAAQAVSVYRLLTRAAKKTFSGDDAALKAAFQEIRSNFRMHDTVTDPTKIDVLLAEGREAATFLQTFVVQGRLNDRGNYAIKDIPDHDAVHIHSPQAASKLPDDPVPNRKP